MKINALIEQAKRDALKIKSELPHITGLNFRFENLDPSEIVESKGLGAVSEPFYDRPLESVGMTILITETPLNIWVHLWSRVVTEPEAIEILYPQIS